MTSSVCGVNARAVRRRAVNLLEHVPPVYCAVMGRRHPEWPLVEPDSDIVIDGYQSSGITFARKAMEHANPSIRIASHVHSWAHVAQGLRRGKPVVVLLRPPLEGIASHATRMRLDDLDLEVERYLRFYRGVERFADGVVLSPFSATTTRFGEVIKAVNEKFGRSFIPFPHEDASAVAAVFEEMEREVSTTDPAADLAWRIARPNPARRQSGDAIRQQLSGERYRHRLAACESVYRRLAAAAPV
jgi:hypothetical protein